MPPEQIETDITGRFERFFTLASGIDHMESRSLPGVSLIKVYFQPGFNSDSAVTSIAMQGDQRPTGGNCCVGLRAWLDEPECPIRDDPGPRRLDWPTAR